MTMPQRVISDLDAVRALANPRRQRIMQQLTAQGPATSATLARDLGLNTGATSYHLRELARHGFVAEIPERAHGRERWWRAVANDFRFPRRTQQDAELRAALDEVTRLSFAADVDALTTWLAHAQGEWADALTYSNGTIRVTVEELHAFFEEYIALVNKYAQRGEPVPDGARAVATRFLAYPAAQTDKGSS